MVIFGPMFQVGCFNACSGVIESNRCSRRFAERPARRGENDPSDICWLFAFQALKNGVVLTVDRQNVYALVARFAHHDLARHDQNFLARHGEILARFDRRQRGAQTARADDCHQHHVRICQAGDLEQTRFARKNPRLVIECFPKNIDLSLINQANRFRPYFIRSGGQLLCIAFRREPDDLHPLRNISRHLQRALTDGPSRAQNNDTLTIHLDRMNRIHTMSIKSERDLLLFRESKLSLVL